MSVAFDTPPTFNATVSDASVTQWSTFSGDATWFFTTGAIVLSLLILEQSVYRYKKQHLPGSPWTIPIIGKFADSLHPTLENYQQQWNSGSLSCVSVFNIFIVMASSNEYARKILNNVNTEPCLVHSAKTVLLPDNWVFLTGKTHVEYRKGLNALFTRKAMGKYVEIQDLIARQTLQHWLDEAKKDPSPRPIMMPARHMNMVTSLRVFCGYHIPDDAVDEISDKYWFITCSLELVNFPFAFPGTKVYAAVQARKVAMMWLEHAAAESKKLVASGAEPTCLLDQWNQVLSDPAYKGRRDFSDHEMAMTVFSFLFASQDAMSSGLVYGFQHLADHPDVLARVREEQERVRGGEYSKPLTIELLDEMPYLQAVVKESLRIKPPVTMVPYKAVRSFKINDEYTVPVSSMIIPSFYNSLHDPVIYPEPDTFNPDRWLHPESPANTNPKQYLVFGSGAHRCIGNEYTLMNIALVLGNAAVMMNWEHVVTPDSYKVKIIATLFPKDECRLKMTPRLPL
ncbi:cytochrome P450 [Fistulina hepatica ATCC 64428]|uniref:Cytochrome P450 n=1 Tax=Fistulina hepatica ATCC 64428 TaxID=1128425 RepID=A0A0D7A4B8_9AGAR|nr:cytochrome P450 [Fistulina hepatica ATCC 64428]